MFYYPAVLKRHTGCFSTIWLVATKGIRVPRRDFLKVNVTSTCDDIVNYVLERVPPPQPGLPRPRFSLYLSSQLQYGVVVVYHKQCAILLEELQSVVGQLVKQKTSQKIDMDDHSRPALDIPDALSLLEETEGAPEPLFGVMYMQHAMPSPSTLIQFEGVDLVEQHPETIDFLLAQADHFPEGDLEMPREEATPGEEEMEMEMQRGGREGDPERERTKELTGSTIDKHEPSDASCLIKRYSRVQDVLPPEVRTRRRRRRPRQLIFFDPETQLSQGVLQRQISDLQMETRRLPLLLPSSRRMLPAAELFNHPCTFLPEEVQFLWRRAAIVTPVSGSDLQVGERGPESTDSEKEREREMAEAAERELERLELSPKEVPRDLAESEMFDISEALSAKKVYAEQGEPYGDIHISPGQNYEEEEEEEEEAHERLSSD
ncbi:Meiotic recombination protein REC8-like protein [Nibea albiflora]|uniref:Meiotic recombination protein REC8-like protein n=1 Tax=Nibea albiflora TaxID=240163 RepID=A0ACB7F679_NIBAL|nr:Meiotic recombination protein REC8-like protein [Nibea albiflora]